MKKLTAAAVIVIVLCSGFFFYSAQAEYEKRYTTGYSEGYLNGVKEGAGSGYTIRDPTYTEMITFLLADKTNENVYDASTYNCYDYTSDLCKNAAAQGYRAGFVYLYFKESAHALVCFNTTDMGLVYVEPQYDSIVKVEVGNHYWNNIPNVRTSFDDIIVRFGIIW